MRLLVLQFVPARQAALPVYRQDLAVAAAMLRQAGHELALLALGANHADPLRQAVNRHRPTHVLADIPPTALTSARHAIGDLAGRYCLPVIAVGPYATSQPAKAISIPGVSALVVGEYERSLVELLASGERESPAQDSAGAFRARRDIPGLWFNGEDGLVRNEPPAPGEDPDALPPGDRELFDYGRIVARTGQAVFYATRGCPDCCAYCLNDWYAELYENARYVRRRSVANLLEEVASVVRRYKGVREVVFADHAFAADADWLADLAEEYPRHVELPFACHVRPNFADARVAGLLARAGCRKVDLEIGSGSNFIREEVLGIPSPRERIVEAVTVLRRQGLRVRAGVFVGSPYEGQVAVEETLDLVSALAPDEIRVRVFYPVPGTRAAEMCQENGWISGRSEDGFGTLHSVLDMPSLPAERIEEIARRFESLLKHRRGKSVAAWVQRLRKLGTTPLRRKK